MGFVTSGKPLTENHPFFRALAHGDDPILRQHVAKFAPGHSGAVYHEEVDEDDQDDQDDEEFVPAVEHVDDSESENEGAESDDDDDSFEDAEEGTEEDDDYAFGA